MITATIVDDEPMCCESLATLLERYCPVIKVLDICYSAETALQRIQDHAPQILFLDIEMPHMNGFEMLQQIKAKNFHVIFTTAYDQYAIKAIKFAAFDYLLKPVDIEELQTAVRNAEAQSTIQNTGERLETLMQNLSTKHQLQKIAVPTMEGLLFFNLSEIIYLQAESNYTNIYFKDHPKLIASRTLGDFEELLPTDIFYRPHNSYLINLNYIKRYIKGDGGQIEMQNGDYVDVSRRKKDEFIKLIRT